MKPKQILCGEPVKYKTNGAYTIACCDCGLTHLTFFRIVNKYTIEMTAYRDEYQTQKNKVK